MNEAGSPAIRQVGNKFYLDLSKSSGIDLQVRARVLKFRLKINV